MGAVVKRQGTAGELTIHPPARTFCAMFQVPDFEALVACFMRLPHVIVRRDNGKHEGETILNVSFSNWAKYQGDLSTIRVRRSRDRKRSRGEEKRREEKRREEKVVGTRPKDRIGFDSTAGRLTGIEVADREAWSRAYPGTSVDAVIADAENFLRDHHADYRDFSRFVRGQFQRAQRRKPGSPTVAGRTRLNDTWAGKTSGEVKL